MDARQSLLFFSYTRADAEFALKLAKSLRSAGANLWIDQLDLKGGDQWDSIIEQALTKAESLLIILSPAAVDSKNVMDEVSFALEENKRVVPVVYKPCKIPFRLRRVHRVDFTADFGQGLERLLGDLGIKRATEEPPPAQPVPAEHLPQEHRPTSGGELTPRTEPVATPRGIPTEPPPHEPAPPKPEPYKVQPRKPKPPEPGKTILLIGGVSAVAIAIVVVWALWWFSSQPVKPIMREFTNRIDMKFVLIPEGSFTMGSRLTIEELLKRFGGEKKLYGDEKPFQRVKIRAFYLQTTPVTQGQWKRVMGDNKSHFKDGSEDCPVEEVSWEKTQEFIKKLNEIEETKDYRLPSEAEWEYACRAGSEAEFFFGDDVERLDEFAWYKKNSDSKTHPVGKKKPNKWGLYDMHGNVWEWVEDDWHDGYKGAPDDGRAWVDNPRGSRRVIRGGSWYYDAWYCRSATRRSHSPDYHSSRVGFRLSRSIALGP